MFPLKKLARKELMAVIDLLFTVLVKETSNSIFSVSISWAYKIHKLDWLEIQPGGHHCNDSCNNVIEQDTGSWFFI